MLLRRLYRLIEGAGTARFFLLRDVFVPGRDFIRHRLVRVSGDRRFLARSLGLDPRALLKLTTGWVPQGPGLTTVGAWYVDSPDGSSGSIFEIEMPASATGIRTGRTAGHRDPFQVGRDYDVDQIDAATSSASGTVVTYPVGPGLEEPPGLTPYEHGASADLEEIG